jgi:hypothetical protein
VPRTPPQHPRQRGKNPGPSPTAPAPTSDSPPAPLGTPTPWLTRGEAPTLADLPLDGPGRVLITHPSTIPIPTDPPLSIGAALAAALAGRTDNFVMLVGYFGHGGRSAYGGAPHDLHDPVALLLAELAEQNDRDDTPIAKARFSLLFGGVSSRASALALELWWWLCRWHSAQPSGAAAWRGRVLAELPVDSSREKVRALIHALLGASDHELHIPVLDPAHPDTQALLASATSAERSVLAELQARSRATPWGSTQASPLAIQTGSLLVYLLQRRAQVRYGAQQVAGKTTRLFHPKLYVIERGRLAPDVEPDAFVFAGSANWSAVALDPSGGEANVEVASIHRVTGAPFSSVRVGTTPHSLGADLAATARALFDAANCFACWLPLEDGQANVCDIALVEGLLRVPERFAELDGLYPVEPAAPSVAADDLVSTPQPTPSAHPRFAAAICRDIEIALGLDAQTLDATIRTLHDLEHAWHGKIPSAYQLDGAARLLALLQHSRGAMLTDEPGLGKTLVAQLVTAAMIHRRLVARRELAAELGVPITKLPRLRVSILAPARVLGRGGRSEQAATQWFRHAAEIRSAVASSFIDEPGLASLAAREDVVDIRLFSNQSLSRALFEKSGKTLREEVVKELHHLACSEIVVVDEAHNFRNGGGRATRLLRFCLSLPVWGESEWRVRQTAGGLLADEPERSDLPTNATSRKILLLSATPFNNRIQDVSTALGHFAKAQHWQDRPGDLADALLRRVDQAPAEAGYWRRSKASKERSSAQTDFALLLAAVAQKHIPGGRALDVDDTKAQRRAVEGAEPTRVRDGGPLYHWTGLHAGLGRIFAAIGETLAQERDGHPAGRGVQLDTRARIDAMLLGYVVQRSRRQVLDFVERNEGLRVCAEMFRAPKQPRAPLPIRSRDADISDHETQEREILEGLFSLILDHEEGDASVRALSMLAYELRYLRGFDRGGGTGARTIGAANFIAFQTVNLVKRLQSCPYAFLMTLVRGMLRTNLYELALVEALARPGQRLQKQRRNTPAVQQSLSLAEDRNKQLALVRIGCERAEQALRERIDVAPRGEQLRRLLGLGKSRTKSSGEHGFFAELIGLGTGHDEKLEERFAADLDLANDYLAAGAHDKKGRRRAKPTDDEATATHWVDRLIEDLARPPEQSPLGSRIATDALLCLDWVFGDNLPQGLLDIVYEGLDGWFGQPMSEIATQLGESDKAIKWLEARLRSDRRATDLLAWLLGQTAVRLAAETNPAARSLAPSGPRSLIFSEYADTIDYLRALLLALHRTCARLNGSIPGERPLPVAQTKRIKALLDDLRMRVIDVCGTLAEEASATVASLGKADANLLPPPIDPSQVAALLPSTDALARVALELVGHAAIVTSRVAGGERLVATQGEQDEPEAAPVPSVDGGGELDDDPEQDPDAGNGSSVDDAPALDAFSPWYQVDVTSADISGESNDAVARRLSDAQRHPVYTLLATEILAEGVNLQECGVAVHYDLPWNPTRLIQRNGRVDRRIDPQVEQVELRRALAKRLLASTTDATTDVRIDTEGFWPPRNVYHLTIPPIEPKLDDERRTMFAKRVRAVLFDKLSGIRRLFGLSAWPVVLGAEDARHALDGSLAYETAAFRRREQLFMHWQTLRHGLALTTEPAATHGAFVCSLGPERLASLHADLAESSERLATDRLRGIALSFWSPAMPRSIPLRSGVDVAPFGTDDAATRQAFGARWGVSVEHTGGVLALVLTDDELLAWRIRSELLPSKTQRTIVEASAIAPERAVDLGHLPIVDWATLTAGADTDEPAGPTSPTTAAEVVLDHLARALLEGETPPMLEELPIRQAWPNNWAFVIQHRRLGELVRRPLREFPRALVPAEPSPVEPAGFNIVVTR